MVNRYKIVFKLGGKRRSRIVEARNYNNAELLANKALRKHNRETGEKAELDSIERLYKGSDKGFSKTEKRIAYGIGTALDFFAGMG